MNELVSATAPGMVDASVDGFPTHASLTEVVEQFTRSIALFAEKSGAGDSTAVLAGSIIAIGALRKRAEAASLLRPTIGERRAFISTAIKLEGLWPAYERVLTSPSIRDVQERNELAQELLDSAATDIVEYGRLADAARAYEDLNEPNFTLRTLNALQRLHPTMSLPEIGAFGAQAAQALVGSKVDAALGAEYMIFDVLARVHLDVDRYTSVLAQASRFCAANATRVVSVASSSGALAGLERSRRLLAESLNSYEAILRTETDESALLRRTIKFHAEVYEDVGGPIFAWYSLLAGLKSRPYDKLISSGVAGLATTVLRSPVTSPWFLGSDTFLRHAAHHADGYRLHGDDVEFRLDSMSDTLSVPVVVDKIFLLLESLAATGWALGNALSQSGFEIPLSGDDASYLGLTPFELTRLALEQRGEAISLAVVEDDCWRFVAGPSASSTFQIALGIALMSSTPVRYVKVERPGVSAPTLRFSLTAYKSFAAAKASNESSLESVVSLLEFRSKCFSELGCVLVLSELYFATACLAIELFKDDASVIPFLRRINALAQALGFGEVSTLVSRVMEMFRKREPLSAGSFRDSLLSYLQHPPVAEPISSNVTVDRL